MKKSTLQGIAELGKKTAIKNAEFASRIWAHQPKVPAKLLEMKK